MTGDPLRLSELGAGTPEQVRSLIETGKQDVPSSDQLDSLSTRLAPLLGVAAAAGVGAGAAATSGSGAAGIGMTVAKIAAGLVVAGGVGAAAVWIGSRSSSPPIESRSGSSAQVSAAHRVPAPAKPTPVHEQPAEAPVAPPPMLPDHGPLPATRPTSNEAKLLDEARAALASNPERALALAREHRTRYPSGLLAQEREVIIIEALSRLGRSAEAREHSDDFARRYPGSAHQRKIESALQGDRPTDTQ
jgi:hypothetical protein